MSMKRATSQCAHWGQRWFCQEIDFESGMCTRVTEPHVKFHERHEFVTSVYRINRQNLKFKCLKKRCAQELTVANCALRRIRARKSLRRFPAWSWYFSLTKIFSLRCQNDRVYVPTMKKETRIELLTLVSDLAVLCLCQQRLYLTCISAWVTIKYHASI